MTLSDSTLRNSEGSFSSTDPQHSESPLRKSANRANPVSPASTLSTPTPSASATMRLPMRTNPAPAALTSKKRVIIRADPTLVTCFDPADKDLYDLWAPKP